MPILNVNLDNYSNETLSQKFITQVINFHRTLDLTYYVDKPLTDMRIFKCDIRRLKTYFSDAASACICKSIILLNEFLSRSNFWARHPNFTDKNNFVAHCILKGEKYCSSIIKRDINVNINMDAIIHKKLYYPAYDIFHKFWLT